MSLGNLINNIEQKLNKPLKIIVVDDTYANISAAEQAANNLDIKDKAVFFNNEKSVIEYLSNFSILNKDSPYSFVITDLEMEDKFSGLYVVEKNAELCCYSVIATGKNLNRSLNAQHGPYVSLIPLNIPHVNGLKNNSETWKRIYSNVLSHLFNYKDSAILNLHNRAFQVFQEKILNDPKFKVMSQADLSKEVANRSKEAILGIFDSLYYDALKKDFNNIRPDSYFKQFEKYSAV